MQLRVNKISGTAKDIRLIELVHPALQLLPAFTAGSHIDVKIPDGPTRQYSLCNDPKDRNRYLIAVQYRKPSGGGSAFMHDRINVGDILNIGGPRNNFPLEESASRHVLLGGGIGITPLISMAYRLWDSEKPYFLHYCCRSPQENAFQDVLSGPQFEGRVSVYYSRVDAANSLDVRKLIQDRKDGDQFYCCGPHRLMDDVRAAAAEWPSSMIKFEAFQPAEKGQPTGNLSEDDFWVSIRSTGQNYRIPAGRSIVEVLRENGVAIETSCEAGTCGSCRTRFLQGKPVHLDYVLSPEEQQEFMMPCVSRSRDQLIVLDL